MAHQPTKKVAAEISVRSHGNLYVGIRARRRLGVGYNDRVRIIVPVDDGEHITFEGCINSSGAFTVGKSAYQSLKPKANDTEHKGTIHVDAIVENVALTWDEAHKLTEKRYENHWTLDCK